MAIIALSIRKGVASSLSLFVSDKNSFPGALQPGSTFHYPKIGHTCTHKAKENGITQIVPSVNT